MSLGDNPDVKFLNPAIKSNIRFFVETWQNARRDAEHRVMRNTATPPGGKRTDETLEDYVARVREMQDEALTDYVTANRQLDLYLLDQSKIQDPK